MYPVFVLFPAVFRVVVQWFSLVGRGWGERPRSVDHSTPAANAGALPAGANVLAVSRMLGHENPSVTLRTYSDLFDTDLDKVSDALDAARRKSVSKWGPRGVQQLRKVPG